MDKIFKLIGYSGCNVIFEFEGSFDDCVFWISRFEESDFIKGVLSVKSFSFLIEEVEE